VLAELGLRLFWPQRYEPHLLHTIVWFHPTRAFSLLPGARLQAESGVEYRVSADGLRGPELPREPPSRGGLRVLVLGDSFVEGLGLPEAETLPAQLGDRLVDAAPGREAEVLGAGVRGGSPAYYRLWLDDLARTRPTVVLVSVFDNDLAEDARADVDTAMAAARVLARVPAPLRSLHLAHLPARWAVARVSGQVSELEQQIGSRRPWRPRRDLNPQFGFYHEPERWLPAWERTRTNLDALLGRIESLGARPLLLYIPLLCTLPNRPCHGRLYARHPRRTPLRDWLAAYCAEREALECLDSYPLLLERDEAGQRSFLANGHLDAEGSAAVAEALTPLVLHAAR
jgi:lysophospholipase L1-like esterase